VRIRQAELYCPGHFRKIEFQAEILQYFHKMEHIFLVIAYKELKEPILQGEATQIFCGAFCENTKQNANKQ